MFFVRRRHSSLLILFTILAASCGSKEDAPPCASDDPNCDSAPDESGGSNTGGSAPAGTGGLGPTGTGGLGPAGTGGSPSGAGGAPSQLAPRPGVVILRGEVLLQGVFEFNVFAAEAAGQGRNVSEWNTWESWPTDFSGVGLALVLLDSGPFSAGQVQDLASVMEAGGTVVVVNEWTFYAVSDNLNVLLSSLGTALRMETGFYFDEPPQTTNAVETLGTHPLLEGVTALRIAASSAVIGCDSTSLVAETAEGVCVLAAERRGLGQLIVSGDTNVFDDTSLVTSSPPSQNRAFVANLFASLPPLQ